MEQAENGAGGFSGPGAAGEDAGRPGGLPPIGIAGLGLIGGSLARAFSRAGYPVAGYDRDGQTLAAALQSGAVASGGTEPSAVLRCPFVFVALYPEASIAFVCENRERFAPGATVTDCCGVKGRVCAALYPETVGAAFRFIGGHPMAGTEESGFAASRADLYDGASFLLTPRPGEDSRAVERLSKLLKAAGFARVVLTTPAKHDRLIAFTSQLPHAIACSYVLSPSCPEHDGFSAGSFRDVSRVAHLSPPLWAELFSENGEALCAELDSLIENLARIRALAAAGDRESLSALLARARAAKDAAGG